MSTPPRSTSSGTPYEGTKENILAGGIIDPLDYSNAKNSSIARNPRTARQPLE